MHVVYQKCKQQHFDALTAFHEPGSVYGALALVNFGQQCRIDDTMVPNGTLIRKGGDSGTQVPKDGQRVRLMHEQVNQMCSSWHYEL